MGVVTKTGDRGETSLNDGSRAFKNHPQIEAYGTVDELNSWIGIIRAQFHHHSIDNALLRIQNECFIVGGHLATPSAPKTKVKLPSLEKLQVEALEKDIDAWESKLPALKNFILPSGSILGAQLHFARTLARRAERWTTTLLENDENPSWRICLMYLNRLSDWFFIAARWVNAQDKIPETVWKS